MLRLLPPLACLPLAVYTAITYTYVHVYTCTYMPTVSCIGLLPSIMYTGVTHTHLHIDICTQALYA